MNFAFAGTPEFAAWVLTHLVALGRRPSSGHLAAGPALRPGTQDGCSARRRSRRNDWVSTACRQRTSTTPAVIAGLQAAGIATLVVAGLRADAAQAPARLAAVSEHPRLAAARVPGRGAHRAGDGGRRAAHGGQHHAHHRRSGRGSGPCRSSVSVGLRDDAGSVERVLALLGACGIDQVLTGCGRRHRLVDRASRASPPTPRSSARPTDPRHLRERPGPSTTRSGRSAPASGRGRRLRGVSLKIWRTWPYGQPGLDAVPEPAGRRPGARAGWRSGASGCSSAARRDWWRSFPFNRPARSKMPAADFLRGYGKRLGERLEPSATASRHPSE